MQRGENVVSIALAAVVLLVVIAMQRRWDPADLKDVASSAEDFFLTTAGMGGQVPDIAGYERLKTFRLGDYRAGLYRATPAPLIFAQGRMVIYDSSNHPVYRIETLEGSKDPWSSIYDFDGKHGQTAQGPKARSAYTRDLTGHGDQDVIFGQYSGGDHCCTRITILELSKDAVTPIGLIDGIDGLPFDGLEVRKLAKGSDWQCIAHRPYMTACGNHYDAADVLAVYGFAQGQFQDQTANFGDFFQDVLRQDTAKWRQEKTRTVELLQTIAVDYSRVGQKDAGNRFFAQNLPQFEPTLQSHNIDANDCLESLGELIDRVPVVNQ
jgi:hypothetical protein